MHEVGEETFKAIFTEQIDVQVPANMKLMPHKHSEDRIYTVISGIFFIGFGDTFNPDVLNAYPPGSVPFGPLGMEKANRRDDPRSWS